MERKKFAVIGLGNMGQHHVRVLSELADVNLVAVCDPKKEIAESFVDKYKVNGYASIDEMISSESLDAVCLVTPTSTHFEFCKKLLNEGIHVMVEKPIADSVDDADRLIELAKEKQCVLSVGHIERFNPAVLALSKVIESGDLGKITSIITRRVGGFPPQIKDANVMIDLAVHDIDIVLYFMQAFPTRVTGHSGRVICEDRDDHAIIFMDFGSSSAVVQVNWITPTRVRQCIVTGSEGYAELDYIAKSVRLYQGDSSTLLEIDDQESLKSELSHFLLCVMGKEIPIVTPEMGRDALRLALEAMQFAGQDS